MTDWAIPQQARLRYTQLFNTNDKNKTGYLSGAQCRDILIQSGLPRNVLAVIWNLSDIDGDGQLSREEFILALFLTNQVRSGKSLPTELPNELIPPSYRQTQSVNSFEDKRRENYEKGRAELERRRLMVIEQQSALTKEQLEKSRIEVNEAKTKIDSLREERDTKMGLLTSLEAQLQALKDKLVYTTSQIRIESAAEIEKQKVIEALKNQLTELSAEKDSKENEFKEIDAKVPELKENLQDLTTDANEIYEMPQEERQTIKHEQENTYIPIIDTQIPEFNGDSENLVCEADNFSSKEIITQYRAIYTFEARNSDELNLNPGDIIIGTNLPQEPGWLSGTLNGKTGLFPETYVEKIDANKELTDISLNDSGANTSQEPVITNHLEELTINEPATTYRAIYAFEARNSDELTLNPGDVIIGTNVPQEPGWLSGTINDKVGLFPEAYVERIDPSKTEPVKNVPKSKSRKPEVATVLVSYKALGPEQLNLEKGQLVLVKRKEESGWWEGEVQVKGKKKQYGWFPADYVKLLPIGGSDKENL